MSESMVKCEVEVSGPNIPTQEGYKEQKAFALFKQSQDGSTVKLKLDVVLEGDVARIFRQALGIWIAVDRIPGDRKMMYDTQETLNHFWEDVVGTGVVVMGKQVLDGACSLIAEMFGKGEGDGVGGCPPPKP